METGIPNARNNYIDWLKGVLIFLVVYGHLIQFVIFRNSDAFWDNCAFKSIYIFHMPLFMAVSGFVSYRSILEKSFSSLIYSRFKQLVVPVICWALLYKSLSFFLAPIILRKSIEGITTFSFMLSVIAEISDSFWFLWAVFGASLIAASAKSIRLDSGLFFTLSALILFLMPDYGNFYLFKYTFPFFCTGYCAAKSNSLAFPVKFRFYVSVPFVVLSVFCFLLWDKESYVYVSRMVLSPCNLTEIVFRYISAATVSIMFVLVTSAIYKIYSFPVISELGKNSMAIYILQSYCFVVFYKLVSIPDRYTVVCLAVAPFLAFFMTLSLHFISSVMYRSHLAGRFLFGKTGKTNI